MFSVVGTIGITGATRAAPPSECAQAGTASADKWLRRPPHVQETAVQIVASQLKHLSYDTLVLIFPVAG